MQTATIIGPQCSSNIGTSATAIGGYTPPSGTTYAAVTELVLANKTNSTISVNLTMFNGSVDYYIAYQATIVAGDSLLFPQKITLTNGWYVRVVASVANAVDATMCVTQYS